MLGNVTVHGRWYRSAGFTLTELALVLTVMGAVLGGIWGASETVYRDYKVGITIRQIHQIVQNMREYYAGTSRPSGWTNNLDITNSLYTKGLIPQEMHDQDKSKTLYYHPLSGIAQSVSIGSFQITVQGASGSYYKLTLYSLDKKSCMKFLGKLVLEVGQGGMLGWPNLNGANVTDSLDALNTACLDAGNQIVITYRLHG